MITETSISELSNTGFCLTNYLSATQHVFCFITTVIHPRNCAKKVKHIHVLSGSRPSFFVCGPTPEDERACPKEPKASCLDSGWIQIALLYTWLRYNQSCLLLSGHSWLLKHDPVNTVLSLKKKHGDIFRLDVGFLPTVVIASYELAADLFARDALAGRSWSLYPHYEHLCEGKTTDGEITVMPGKNLGKICPFFQGTTFRFSQD